MPTYDGLNPGSGFSLKAFASDDFGFIQVPTRFANTDYHDYARIYSDSGSALVTQLDFCGAGLYSYSGNSDDELRASEST